MNSSTNNEPVFRTVGQALFVAFVMEVTPPSTKGSTQLLIEDLMKQRYGEAPIPKGERSINMGGMSPLELRGQCAMIRASVNDHLAGQERDAIYARFGHQVTRATGVMNLREHYQSLCNTPSRDAIDALLWALYVPGVRQFPGESVRSFNARRKKRENDWSLRGIEKAYGVGKNVLHRDQQMLRKLCHSVEMLAQGKLEELFIGTRLIGDPADA
jgi:hypothetical protein